MDFLNVENNISSCVKGFMLTSVSGVAAIKGAVSLRTTMAADLVPGLICGPDENTLCRFGSVGTEGLPFCAEKIDWLQPFKPTLQYTGKSVSFAGEFSGYVVGASVNNPLTIAISATFEELLCRGFLQRGIFRELPRCIISKISPKHASLVDHPIAKATQIVASSIIFGLLHTKKWECGYGGTIQEMAGGMIFGIIAETRFGLLGSSFAHTVANCYST